MNKVFIDFLILNEFATNPDGYRLSTFMSKDRQGKLKMGPIWDFNLGFGNDDRPAFFNSANWVFNFNNYYPNDTWLIHFWWKNVTFRSFIYQQAKSKMGST